MNINNIIILSFFLLVSFKCSLVILSLSLFSPVDEMSERVKVKASLCLLFFGFEVSAPDKLFFSLFFDLSFLSFQF